MTSLSLPASASSEPQRPVEFLDFLLLRGMIDQVAANRIRGAKSASGQREDAVILELGLVTEPHLANAMADFCGYTRILPMDFPTEAWPDLGLPEAFLASAGLLIVDVTDREFTVATSHPLDISQITALAYFLDRKESIRVAEVTPLANHIRKLASQNLSSVIDADQGADVVQDDDVERLRDVARDAPTIKLLNRLISMAVDLGASDIHLEPFEDHQRVRFRIDGALQEIERLPKDSQAGLTSRVKILARLNIAEHRIPQDGRIRMPVRGRDVDIRVATTPIVHGESVALRLLDRAEVALDLTALGFLPKDSEKIEQLLRCPNGILLVTGPTGSGKTTTLYAALSLLNRPESKLFSIEDPVEYRLQGVNQIQVKPQIGLDFASILRSVLRQDPDIIMLGEMRDVETVRTALQASLTGHLVLSTLHTNSAAAAVTRLVDMGAEEYLIATCLRGILSQRLVRKLCPVCKIKTKPSPAQASLLDMKTSDTVYEAAGCSSCHNTGFQGRTVIYELLTMTQDVCAEVSRRGTELEIDRVARKGGLVPMIRLAREKILAGQSSVEEVLRVTSGSQE